MLITLDKEETYYNQPKLYKKLKEFEEIYGKLNDNNPKVINFLKNLTQWFPDDHIKKKFIKYVKQLIITLKTENLLIFIGKGSNGKTTVSKILTKMFDKTITCNCEELVDFYNTKIFKQDFIVIKDSKFPNEHQTRTISSIKPNAYGFSETWFIFPRVLFITNELTEINEEFKKKMILIPFINKVEGINFSDGDFEEMSIILYWLIMSNDILEPREITEINT